MIQYSTDDSEAIASSKLPVKSPLGFIFATISCREEMGIRSGAVSALAPCVNDKPEAAYSPPHLLYSSRLKVSDVRCWLGESKGSSHAMG